MEHTYLRLSTGTSRGRDTYGYTIMRLRDETTGLTFRCMGGGYDMVGTVLADWAVSTHHDRLAELAGRAFYVSDADGYRRTDGADAPGSDAFYGMARIVGADGSVRVSIDGGCGVESVWRILKAAGIRPESRSHDRRGNTTGWLVEIGDQS